MLNSAHYGAIASQGQTQDYLLDLYPSDSAFSLRRLKSDVTNCVNIRRDSDDTTSVFSPEEVEDGTMLAWVTENDVNGNGYIRTFYNQSNAAASNNLSNPTNSEQPLLVENGVLITKNGHPALKCGNGENLGNFKTSSGTRYDIFSVFTPPNPINATWNFISRDGNNHYIRGDQFANFRGLHRAGNSFNAGIEDEFAGKEGDQILHNYTRFDLAQNAYVNGIPNPNNPVNGTTNSDMIDPQNVGLDVIDFQEVIAYSGAVSDPTTRAAITADINNYYNIY